MAAPSSFSARSFLPDEDVFVDADFRHRIRLKRGSAESYFARGEEGDTNEILAERRHWIRTAPERHALAMPEAGAALEELAQAACGWGGTDAGDIAVLPGSAAARMAFLGERLEPDVVLLDRGTGATRMIAGSVCFPSSWAPEEKMGTTLERIHDVVPGLNQEVGVAIESFLGRLGPGVTWLRANWGLSASSERNQHPARGLARLTLPIDPERTWVRVEYQSLLVLPRTGAVVFGIRVEQRPLDWFRTETRLAAGLARGLRSMPDPMAAYKGLAEVRTGVVRCLEGYAGVG